MKKGYKKCPFCANEIKEDTVKCPHCEEFFNEREIKRNKMGDIHKDNSNKIIVLVMGVIIVLLLAMVIHFYIRLNNINQDQTNIFEKKKMCAEMRIEYENYLRDKYDIEEDNNGYYQTTNGIELFYNKELDTCIGSYYLYSNMYSLDKTLTMTYSIDDYMNGNKEIYHCFNKNNSNCEFEWEKKIEELKN